MKRNENFIEMFVDAEHVAGQTRILTSDLCKERAEKQIVKLYDDTRN